MTDKSQKAKKERPDGTERRKRTQARKDAHVRANEERHRNNLRKLEEMGVQPGTGKGRPARYIRTATRTLLHGKWMEAAASSGLVPAELYTTTEHLKRGKK